MRCGTPGPCLRVLDIEHPEEAPVPDLKVRPHEPKAVALPPLQEVVVQPLDAIPRSLWYWRWEETRFSATPISHIRSIEFYLEGSFEGKIAMGVHAMQQLQASEIVKAFTSKISLK